MALVEFTDCGVLFNVSPEGSHLQNAALILFDESRHIFRERFWRMDSIREDSNHVTENAIEYVRVTFSVSGILAVAALTTPRPIEQTVWVPLPVLLVAKLPRNLSQRRFDLAASGVVSRESPDGED
ncbi:hypothetical protein PM082_013933 [Marasmius tenuissimus]|nr:hypothetical protein PM082_001523 [Marasmius tenuissimus]KAJ8088686.1 hypothetical protein PM082_013929 [Marasmius tenuissimus]KAJ8088690.1 hypothetical protein PM082_013933 [Marasmius tenuissimus]